MDHGRYRPTPAQRRALWAGDRTCRFPGCRRNALACEPDHVHEHHHGGPTALGNLASLCRKHHTYKSLGLWTSRMGPGRTLEFTSPAGRTYHTNPPMPWHDDGPLPHGGQHPGHQPPANPTCRTKDRTAPGPATAASHVADTGGNRPVRSYGWDTPATADSEDEAPPF